MGKEIGVVFYKAINYASAYDYLSAEKVSPKEESLCY